MAYLNMQAEVIIGDIVLPHINSFTINESIEDISDYATITIAKNYKQLKGNPILKYIQAGYPVEIKCGYNGDIATEFTGFVKPGISAEWPVKIECDELFLLRQGNVIVSDRNITLIDLLTKIAPQYEVEAPKTNLGKTVISNVSPYRVLQDLKKKYGFYSRINGNKLSVGFAYDFNPSFTQTHQYIIGRNVKDSKGLKFNTEVDFNVRVEAHVLVKGKKVIVSEGSSDKDAKVQKIDLNEYMTEEEAQKTAKARLHKILYAGFTGNIVGFGFPRTHAGDALEILNPKLPEQDGTYMIEKVEVEYAPSHINRDNTLSFKIV